MTLYPTLALFDQPWVIIVVVVLALVLFGADKLPKLARSAGQAKKEFLAGQAEGDAALQKARDEASAAKPSTPDNGTPAP